jgi:alkane 1-monooxygenase
VSNWVLINLARHADHHLTASKRYQVLHTIDAAPQLPAGYPLMILLALVPPLWRRVMDPRVAEWERSLDARPAARSTPVA